MKIGITERGDAGLDFDWVKSIENNTVDGAILITKNVTDKFIKEVLRLRKQEKKLLIHCTCTGWGGSKIEPFVPKPEEQLKRLKQLIDAGFPKQNCVLRIDPIFPTEAGLYAVTNVIDTAYHLGLLPDIRIRISVYDEYRHIKQRLKEAGDMPLYGSQLYAPAYMMQNLTNYLKAIKTQYKLNKFETCAEKNLTDKTVFSQTGCVSGRDILLLGFDNFQINFLTTNPQNRTGCKCLSCKTELLNNKKRCQNKCLYCYWKD